MINELIAVLNDSSAVYVAVQSEMIRMESAIDTMSVEYDNDILTFGEVGNSITIRGISNYSIDEDDGDWWLKYRDQLINIYPY